MVYHLEVKEKKMLKTNIKLIIVSLFLSNLVLAGCGKCQINNKKDETKKSSALVTSVPSLLSPSVSFPYLISSLP